MRHTCVDCSVFNPTMGMQAHPVFNDDQEWAHHLHERHAGPAPVVLEEPPKVKVKTAPEDITVQADPPLKPAKDSFARSGGAGFGSTWTPGDQGALNRDFSNRLGAFHDRMELLTSQLSAMETENAGLHKSIQDLEAQIGGQAAINEEFRRRIDEIESR